jgi:hypothetical protein
MYAIKTKSWLLEENSQFDKKIILFQYSIVKILLIQLFITGYNVTYNYDKDSNKNINIIQNIREVISRILKKLGKRKCKTE